MLRDQRVSPKLGGPERVGVEVGQAEAEEEHVQALDVGDDVMKQQIWPTQKIQPVAAAHSIQAPVAAH